MKKCKEVFPRKVFCEDCKHKKFESFEGICGEYICKINYTWKYNYRTCWIEYIECSKINKNNDCPDFEPKENIFKKLSINLFNIYLAFFIIGFFLGLYLI